MIQSGTRLQCMRAKELGNSEESHVVLFESIERSWGGAKAYTVRGQKPPASIVVEALGFEVVLEGN